jgi:hypothetical protein
MSAQQSSTPIEAAIFFLPEINSAGLIGAIKMQATLRKNTKNHFF